MQIAHSFSFFWLAQFRDDLRLNLADLELVGHQVHEGEGGNFSRCLRVVGLELCKMHSRLSKRNIVGPELVSYLSEIPETALELFLLSIADKHVCLGVRLRSIFLPCFYPVVHLVPSDSIRNIDLAGWLHFVVLVVSARVVDLFRRERSEAVGADVALVALCQFQIRLIVEG